MCTHWCPQVAGFFTSKTGNLRQKRDSRSSPPSSLDFKSPSLSVFFPPPVRVLCLFSTRWPGFLVALGRKHNKKHIYSIFPEAEVPHTGGSEINLLLDDHSHVLTLYLSDPESKCLLKFCVPGTSRVILDWAQHIST